MNRDIIEQKYLEDGTNYQVIVPEHVDQNTPIILYEHGSGGYGLDYEALNEKLSVDGSNAIIVYYNRGLYKGLDQTEILDAVSSEYGVPITNFNGVSHSAGMAYSMATMAKVIDENPNMGPQTLMALDGSLHYAEANGLTEDVLKTLGQNGTVLYAIHRIGMHTQDDEYTAWISEYGINVIRITDLNANSGDFGLDHAKVKNDYAYNDLLSFQAGTGTFPLEGYTAQIYENGQWIDIDISGMTQEQVYNVLGIDTLPFKLDYLSSLSDIPTAGVDTLGTSSDSAVLNVYLNNVLGAIRSSSFVSNSYDYNTAFSSTTNVPSQIPALVKEYFSAKALLLEKIAQDMYEFAKIGESKTVMDLHMASEAEEIGTVTAGMNPTNDDSLK